MEDAGKPEREVHELIKEIMKRSDKAKVQECKENITASDYLIEIGYSLRSDSEKLEIIDLLKDDFSKVAIIRTLTNDDTKIKLLDDFTDKYRKIDIIDTLEDDDKKIELLKNFQDKSDKAEIIETMKDDDKKIMFLEAFQEENFKAQIIESLKDDNKKMMLLKEIQNENFKAEIIESMKDDNKVKCMNQLQDTKLIGDLIKGIKDDNIKCKQMENIQDEKLRAEIIETIKDDGIKLILLEDIKQNELKANIMKTIEDDNLKISLLQDIPDKNLQLEIIKTIIEDRRKLDFIDNAENQETKVQIIKSMKSDDFKIYFLQYITEEVLRAKVIKSLRNDNKRIRLLQDIEDKDLQLEIIQSIRDDQRQYKCLIEYTDIQKKVEELSTKQHNSEPIDLPPELTIGVEIETEGIEYTNVNRIAYLMNVNSEILEQWDVVGDWSLVNGAEFVSPILTSNKESMEQLDYICNFAQGIGEKTSDNCGGHISLGIEGYFSNLQGNNYLKAWENFLTIYRETEELIYKMSNEEGDIPRSGVDKFAPQQSKSFERMYGDGSIQINSKEDLEKAKAELKTLGKYTALNFSDIGKPNKDRLEFRIANAYINPETIKQTILLYGKMIQMSKESINNEKLQSKLEHLKNHDLTEADKVEALLDLLFEDEQTKKIYRDRWDSVKDNEVFDDIKAKMPTFQRGNYERQTQQEDKNIQNNEMQGKPLEYSEKQKNLSQFTTREIGESTINAPTVEKQEAENKIKGDMNKQNLNEYINER